MERNSTLLLRYIHRVNNEVGAIRVMVEVIQHDKEDLLEKETFLADYLNRISRSAKNVLALADDIKLSLISPEATGLFSVESTLSDALAKSSLPDSIILVIEIPSDIPDVRATDSLDDVFENIITNASEAMPEGGELQIRARLRKDKKQVEIFFRDSGQGMPPHMVKSLFQHGISTKRRKGHGFGLWWCREYLINIAGNIDLIWTESGKGSTFRVSLPIDE